MNLLPIGEMLASLERLGVRVRLNVESLRVHAPVGVVTPDIQTTLQRRKPEIIRKLRGPPGHDRNREAGF